MCNGFKLCAAASPGTCRLQSGVKIFTAPFAQLPGEPYEIIFLPFQQMTPAHPQTGSSLFRRGAATLPDFWDFNLPPEQGKK